MIYDSRWVVAAPPPPVLLSTEMAEVRNYALLFYFYLDQASMEGWRRLYRRTEGKISVQFMASLSFLCDAVGAHSAHNRKSPGSISGEC